MKYHHCESIIGTKEFFEDDTHSFYRIIESLSDERTVHSLFVSTEQKNELEENFAYDIARDRETAETLCDYLCRMKVGALSLNDVLSDNIGADAGGFCPEIFSII